MKVKEVDRTANIAWSPADQHPIYLAAGTAAQQLDATFSTVSALELYDLNLNEPGYDMCMKGSVVSNYRFHKIIWGRTNMKSSETANGIIAAGADGNLLVYDAAKILSGEDSILFHKTNHSGAVRALDFNKFQECLLATGASDSEIYIWDLNNPSAPMTPGTKSQLDDVTSLAWNCQVQYILASTFPTKCVVWDLRKNEPIIKVSDSASRMHCKVVAWHPEVATQLCIASDDDHSPLIQLWDLRFATTPVRNLERHQRGILSIAWCPHDPDLLLSCGKENNIICWNPNSPVERGEVLCELPTATQWSFDISWCLRNPAVIASSSCDGRVSVYSLMGGQQQIHCSSKIAESFPGSDKMDQPHVSASSSRQISLPLQKPPKWMRRPVGASFGFGGKMVFFHIDTPGKYSTAPLRNAYIYQVMTEPQLLKRTAQLEQALNTKNFYSHCENRIKECDDKDEKMNWTFLQAMFSSSPRAGMLSLLGFDSQQMNSEVLAKIDAGGGPKLPEVEQLSKEVDHLSMSTASKLLDTATEDLLEPFIIETQSGDVDSVLNKALLTGNIGGAVELCIQENRWADALVLAQASGYDLFHKTQMLYFRSVTSNSSKLISAVGSSDWISLVKNCDIDYWKECLAAILTYAKQEEFSSLCELLGSRLASEKDNTYMKNAALCYISSGNFEGLAKSWTKFKDNTRNVDNIQCVIEQIMLLRMAVAQMSGTVPPTQSSELTYLFGLFASMLSAQGNLAHATIYLTDVKEYSLLVLRDRMYQSLGLPSPYIPFTVIDVQKTASVPYQLDSTIPEQTPKSQQQFNYGNDIPYSRQSLTFPSSSEYQPKIKGFEPGHLFYTGSQPPLGGNYPKDGQVGRSLTYYSVFPPNTSYYEPINPNLYQPPSSNVCPPPSSNVCSPPSSNVCPPPSSNVCPPPSNNVCPPPSGNVYPPPSNNICPSPGVNVYPPTSSDTYESRHSNIGQLPVSNASQTAPNNVGQVPCRSVYQPSNNVYAPPNSSTASVHTAGSPRTEMNSEFSGQHLSQKYSKHVPDDFVYPGAARLQARGSFSHHYSAISSEPAEYSPYEIPPPSQTISGQHLSQKYSKHVPDDFVYPGAARLQARGSFTHHYSAISSEPAEYSPYEIPPPSQTSVPTFPKPTLPPVPILPTSFGEIKTGWNDPPLLKQHLGTQVMTSTYETQPITSPLSGVPVPDIPQATPESNSYISGTNFGDPPTNQPNLQEPLMTTQMKMETAQEKIEPPKEKKPFPAEHIVLQNVFEDLRLKCLQLNLNAQMKRKLEDVVKKLEYLYDQIRENTLSQPILTGLHDIVQAVLQNDYQTALRILCYLVSTTNFSEISGFMPGVKVLLQTAFQLKVYIN